MLRRVRLAAGVGALTLVCVVISAGSAGAAAPVVAAQFVLGAGDLPSGAKVKNSAPRLSVYMPEIVVRSAYDRAFGSVAFGSTKMLTFESSAAMSLGPSGASHYMNTTILKVPGSSAAQAKFLKKIQRGLVSAGVTVKSGRVVRAVAITAGTSAADFVLRFKTGKGTRYVGEIWVRTGTVLSLVYWVATKPLDAATTQSLATTMAGKLNVAAGPPVPINTTIPTISGTAKVGQTLTGVNGTWNPPGTSYSFDWYRCDSTGSVCNDTYIYTSTYTIVAGDAGSQMELGVIATTSSGASIAYSNPTATITS